MSGLEEIGALVAALSEALTPTDCHDPLFDLFADVDAASPEEIPDFAWGVLRAHGVKDAETAQAVWATFVVAGARTGGESC